MAFVKTGTTDIPLTKAGSRLWSVPHRRLFLVNTLPNSLIILYPSPDESFDADVIKPENVSHVFVSPRQRAQKTADLVSFKVFNDIGCGAQDSTSISF